MRSGVEALQRRICAVEEAANRWRAEMPDEEDSMQAFLERLLPTMREDHRALLLAARAEFKRLFAEMRACRREWREGPDPWQVMETPGGRLFFAAHQQFLMFLGGGPLCAMPPEWVEALWASDPLAWFPPLLMLSDDREAEPSR